MLMARASGETIIGIGVLTVVRSGLDWHDHPTYVPAGLLDARIQVHPGVPLKEC